MSTVVLLLGISAIAAPLGFMVGGSATPVVGAILPAIFGLVIAAVGLYQIKFPSKDQLELFTELQKNELLTQYLKTIKDYQEKAPLKVGLILLVFGIVYQLGAITGITARTHQWFLPKQKVAPEFPWSSSTRPVSTDAAFKWITFQSGLLALGYTNEQIRELYQIQVSEWETLKAINHLLPKLNPDDQKPKGLPFESSTLSIGGTVQSPPYVFQGPMVSGGFSLEKQKQTEFLDFVQEYQKSQNSNVFQDRQPGLWQERNKTND
jgi:hypothetical protein